MVLGIRNRTENWKTACHFVPYSREPGSLLKLVGRLGETDDVETGKVQMELFWKGTRDWLHGKCEDERRKSQADILTNCEVLFGDLRSKVCDFKGLRCFRDFNYDVSSQSTRERLFQNMYNTEIDIVIETPKRLFIGEAKREESFGADSKRILVHQLIRQYVMARVLLTTVGCDKKVIPFIVGDRADTITKTRQVQFMIAQHWMKGCNVLDWNEIAKLRGNGTDGRTQ